MADERKSSKDEFEDIYSSSEKEDFEDIYSDSGADETEEAFQNVYSESDANAEDDGKFHVHIPQHRELADTPEQKPYTYNYDAVTEKRAKQIEMEMAKDSEEPPKPEKKRKKKKHIGLKIFAVVLVLILLLTGGAGIYGYQTVKTLLGKVNYKPLEPNQYIDSAKLAHDASIRNILLVGVDARAGEDADETRSDTMMLISIDPNNQQLKLTSILRDSYVELPHNKKMNKINAAQSKGGRQLLVDTIEYNFHVDIDNYMLVNFEMFTSIIDELGGIDVEVTEKEAKYINSKDHMTPTEAEAFPEKIEAGPSVHFTGAQALWYSRMRYLDSDFYRTKRQRKVITQILASAKNSDLKTLYGIAEKIMPMVETDLTTNEIIDLGKNVFDYMKYDLVQMQIPMDKTWKSERKKVGSCLVMDMEKNREGLRKFIYEKAEVATEETTKK